MASSIGANIAALNLARKPARELAGVSGAAGPKPSEESKASAKADGARSPPAEGVNIDSVDLASHEALRVSSKSVPDESDAREAAANAKAMILSHPVDARQLYTDAARLSKAAELLA